MNGGVVGDDVGRPPFGEAAQKLIVFAANEFRPGWNPVFLTHRQDRCADDEVEVQKELPVL